MKIQVLVFDGFDELDVVGAYEPLRMAGLDTRLVSLHGQELVTAAYGLKVQTSRALDTSNLPDLLIVPGGGWLTKAKQGAWQEFQEGTVINQIKLFHEAGVKFAAVCTGVLLLGHSGLLAGRPATTNHSAIAELQELGAIYAEARVLDDGQFITASGVTASIDLGLYIVEKFCGVDRAAEIAKSLHYSRGPVWVLDT